MGTRAAGSSLRLARHPQGAQLHGGHPDHPRARHRRQHRHLQRRQRAADRAAAVSRRSRLVFVWAIRPAKATRAADVGAGAQRTARGEFALLRRGRHLGERARGSRAAAATPNNSASVSSPPIFSAPRRRAGIGPTSATATTRPGGTVVDPVERPVWQRRFGGDPSIVGRRIDVNGQPATVVGVMPASFRLLSCRPTRGAGRS